MGPDPHAQGNGLPEIGLTLDDLIRRGARQGIHHVIEAEGAQRREHYEHVTTVQGHRAVVRTGDLPERDVLTGVGPVAGKVPNVRDRSGRGVNSIQPSCRPLCGNRRGSRRRGPGCR